MIAFERAIAAELARHGPVNDETFRWLRRAAGVERNELASILGVTPETLAGWESERRSVERAAWLVVAALVLDGVEGPRALRPRLAHPPPRATSGERNLELPPAGLVGRLLGILAGPNEFTDVELAEALDVDRAALRAQLASLAEHGLVRSTSESEPKRWSPTARDLAALLAAAARAGVDLDPALPRPGRRSRV
jgi:DNA-binding transcriptional regulator YiaG